GGSLRSRGSARPLRRCRRGALSRACRRARRLFMAQAFRGGGLFAPDSGEGGLDLPLETDDQFAVGGDQRLLGFDLGNDGLLCGEGREGDWVFQYFARRDVALRSSACGPLAEIVE